jgi:hypothetical protein
MDDKERQKLTVVVSPEEAETIKAAAAALGISVSEYGRNRMLPSVADATSGDVGALLRHLIYMESRTHIALYSIHEMADTLPTAELKKIYDHAITESNKYMVALPDLMVRDRARIAAQAAGATAAANGNPSETNGAQMRRCSDPVHARLFGEDQCFICHVPIEARH